MELKLLTPLTVGKTVLSNRVVMAPLTRCRSGQPGDIPTDLNAEYYAQRAGAGLIVSEATQISKQGQGYAKAPGIYTDVQEAGWKKVVNAVHAKGGRIASQLWHVGRVSHSYHQENGGQPVAPSALIAENTKSYIIKPDGVGAYVPCEMPRALELSEIPGIIDQYRQAAIRALRAGFDFVEVHAANGYLLQQFTSTNTNLRTDKYGGSLENRARIVLEVLDAVCEVLGKDKVGIRLSPYFNINGIADNETESMTVYLTNQFSQRGIAYLHIAEPSWVGGIALTDDFRKKIRRDFNGALILCGEYTPEKAEASVAAGLCDAVGFGRLYIANPDLVERIRRKGPFNTPDRSTFYDGGAAGYTDYPSLD